MADFLKDARVVVEDNSSLIVGGVVAVATGALIWANWEKIRSWFNAQNWIPLIGGIKVPPLPAPPWEPIPPGDIGVTSKNGSTPAPASIHTYFPLSRGKTPVSHTNYNAHTRLASSLAEVLD